MTFTVGKVSQIFEGTHTEEATSLEELLERLASETDVPSFIVHMPRKNLNEHIEVLVYDDYYE